VLPVVVLAGGLGTRLAEISGGRMPKVLVPVAGRPFLDYKLAGLAAQGVEDVVLLVASFAEDVEAHVGDGSAFGVHARCVRDGPRLLGTGGAVLAALPALPEAFWVTYGDSFLEFDVAAAEQALVGPALGVMTVLHNRNEVQPSNARVEGDLVTSYVKGDAPASHEHLDYGMVALRSGAFPGFSRNTVFDLGAVFSSLATEGRLRAYEVSEPFRDIGTPDALRATEAYFERDETWERLMGNGERA